MLYKYKAVACSASENISFQLFPESCNVPIDCTHFGKLFRMFGPAIDDSRVGETYSSC